MARTPTEQLREQVNELATNQAVNNAREASIERDVAEVKALLEKQRYDVAELRQDNALLRQRLDEHLKRVEKWDTRFWGLIVILVGALLSLSAGLIVVLVKK